MGNITIKENRSKKGNIYISDDSDGINIINSDVFLESDGDGDDLLADDGTYTHHPHLPIKQAVYNAGIPGNKILLEDFGGFSRVISGSLLFSGKGGTPLKKATSTSWILDKGNYIIDLNLFFHFNSAGDTVDPGSRIIIKMIDLDITDGPLPADSILTIPYQGTVLLGSRTWFEKVSIPIKNIGENNELKILMALQNVFIVDLYELLGSNSTQVRTTVKLTKVSE